MAQFEKKSDVLNPVAIKFLHIIDTAVNKLKILVLLEALNNSCLSDDVDDDMKEAINIYRSVKRQLMYSDLLSLSDSDSTKMAKLMFVIKKISGSKWERYIPEDFEFSGNLAGLIDVLAQFRSIVHDTLTQTAEEWNKQEKFIKKYTKVSAHTNSLISRLGSELPTAKIATEEKVKELEEIIQDIKDDIDRVERFADGEIQNYRKNGKWKIQSIEENTRKKVQELQAEKERLKGEVEAARLCNVKLHTKLKEEGYNYNKSIAWIINEYGEKMIEIQNKIDEEWKALSAELSHCRDICNRYAETKEKAAILRAESRKTYEEELRKKLEMRLKLRAVEIIQHFWRSLHKQPQGKPKKASTPKKGKKKKGKK